MKRTLLYLVLLLSVGPAAEAQETQRDSLRTDRNYPIDEVVVTGARHRTDVRHLSQTVSVVDRSQIETSMQSSLLPVLTEQVPDCSSPRAA